MLGPVMFIGVGGSGGNTVRAIRQLLLERLHSYGWEGDFPECWQTLWIDTIAEQSHGGFPAPPLPKLKYLGVVPRGAEYSDMRDRIVGSIPKDSRNSALSGWLMEDTIVPLEKGAGQYRALGHVAGIHAMDEMLKFLRNAYGNMTSGKANDDLQKINSIMGLSSGMQANRNVYIISSMAGGSGSGLFQDVAELLKAVEPSLDNFMHVMLYGSDVFGLSLDDDAMKWVHGNTLGALAEVMNGIWSDKKSKATRDIYGRVGIVPADRRFGGKYHWLIGARNNERALGNSTSEIFYAVASSMSALTMSSETRIWLDDYIVNNVFSASKDMLDESDLKVNGKDLHYQPFAAMGFGRVTLGMDRFTKYACEAITREAIDKRLLWPDYQPVADGIQNARSVLIDERFQQLWPDFLKKCGLRERGESQNDILDALKGDGQELSKFVEDCRNNVTGGKNAAAEPSAWEKRIKSFVHQNHEEAIRNERKAINEAAQKWVKSIQVQILEATAEAMLTGGSYVTRDLLTELVEKEIPYLVEKDLPATIATAERNFRDVPGKLMKLLNIGKDKLMGNDKEVKASLDEVGESIKFLDEAARAKVAIELLEDLSENFLKPLLTAVSDYPTLLRLDRTKDGEHDFQQFPALPSSTSDEVPVRFKPPTTEQSLIDFSEFPTLLEKWTQEAIDVEMRSNYRHILVNRAALGKHLDEKGDSDPQLAIKPTSSWIPKSELFKTDGFAQKASFEIKFGVSDIFQNARELLHEKGGQLSIRVNMGLREYIDNVADPKQKDQYEKDFLRKFNTALISAQPMIEESSTALGTIHNAKPGFLTIFSKIPLQGLKLEQQVVAAVRAWDPQNTYILQPDAFSVSTGVSEITIFCSSKRASNPAVYKSLMEPIYADWVKRRDSYGDRAGFWKDRRTKPFIESIPAAREQIERMIEGWIVLGLTKNRVVDSKDQVRGPKVSVFHKLDGEWFDFPHPLLGCPRKPSKTDTLPAVLTSLSIALLEFNDKGSDLKPFKAYHALLEAADTSTQMEIFTDYLSSSESDSKVTIDDLINTVTKEIETLNTKIKGWESEVNIFRMPLQYEMRDEWLAAFKRVEATLKSMKLTAGSEEELG